MNAATLSERAGRRDQASRWLACSQSPAYFIDRYGWVYDAASRAWVRFTLWPAQVQAASKMSASRLVVIFKARQIGMTWLAVGHALWLLLFRPGATVLLFSRRDDEAVHLLTFRLRGMYDRLPPWLQARAVARANAHELALSNGSMALAFPTTGGRSYTATLAIVDEADHTEDLDALLNAVKPTVDAGGSLVLLNTVDKSRPDSAFKRIYRSAVRGENGYAPLFLPWHARPGRDAAWYAAQERDVLARTGARDDLFQEYPASDLEALAPRALDKRFLAEWLARCAGTHLIPGHAPDAADPEQRRSSRSAAEGTAPNLTVHVPPQAGHSYVIGADPAGGSPQSDESAAAVLDAVTGEQVATLAGRIEPDIFAGALDAAGRYYNNAPVLVERNNHGHAVLLWLREFSALCGCCAGWMASRAGLPRAPASRWRSTQPPSSCVRAGRGPAIQLWSSAMRPPGTSSPPSRGAP